MNWYLVHTKPRQELCALENLQNQGYECYFPTILSETIRAKKINIESQPLFPRYIFIRLGDGLSAQSWRPIRSTKGVNRIVVFGHYPAKVDDRIINFLKNQESTFRSNILPLYKKGDKVQIISGPFTQIEGIYQMTDSEQRILVLIELMSKPVIVPVPLAPSAIRKIN
jgi:transcriptional antiterminator RfaH